MNKHEKIEKELQKLKPCICGCTHIKLEVERSTFPFCFPLHRYHCFAICNGLDCYCENSCVLSFSMTEYGAVRKAVKTWNRRTAKAKKKQLREGKHHDDH